MTLIRVKYIYLLVLFDVVNNVMIFYHAVCVIRLLLLF